MAVELRLAIALGDHVSHGPEEGSHGGGEGAIPEEEDDQHDAGIEGLLDLLQEPEPGTGEVAADAPVQDVDLLDARVGGLAVEALLEQLREDDGVVGHAAPLGERVAQHQDAQVARRLRLG
ncbi:MAG: hypothetical protein OEM05_05515 [Myxococcales bacterium]|nr:hypothetical protein [Myxococcales bacterium]